ncbi:uncharacterized protein H6S33_001237 [Morchella sextelata]|uniref:uncharacterized protein n=1 Tax=Morchella sextelata TaxID=1174677 RepID=UPI001D04E9AD|nr:uncharacterized protein H6S33_001237 [Morchella sextelata]KAH0609009.1 hypothetical protein H6S33_001237 [Morchella sextelata]
MSQPNPHADPKLRVITTQAPRRSFPLAYSPNSFFTGDLFDRLALFLHKHNTAFTSIDCVARGIDKATALADGPTICICVIQDRVETGKSDRNGKTIQLEEDVNGESCGDIKTNVEREEGSYEETEVRREVPTLVPPGESVEEKGVGKLEGSMDDDEVVDREKGVEDTRKKESGELEKTEKEDSIEGGAEQKQRRDHYQTEDVLNFEKIDEGNTSSDQKSEPINSWGRNMDKDQDERQEKKTGTNGSDDHNTQSTAELHLETKTGKRDTRQHEVSRPQRIEQKTNTYTSGIARLFCKSDVALTIPPEILTVEFVSVILHEDGRVET